MLFGGIENRMVKNVEAKKAMDAFSSENAWGLATNVDLYGCNPETIRDAGKIKQFVAELCELIDMKRFGETEVVHFGPNDKVAGYSMTQLIETSLISGHFANSTNAAYLDVFSCKEYDPDDVAEYAKKFFGAESVKINVVLRE